MRVNESGPEAAEAVVFLHGNGASADMWRAHAEFLSGYRCLAPDFPGFGERAGEAWTSIPAAAAEVADLIRARTSGRAHVVGISLGGVVAIELLAEAPELVDHAVVDGASVLPLPGLALAKLALRLSPPFIASKPVTAAIARALGVPAAGRAEFLGDLRRMSADAFVAAFIEALDFRQPGGLETAESPTLFVAGAREPSSTLASNRHLARVMPKAVARVVPGAFHGWVATEPLLHCRTVAAWIADRPLPANLAEAG